MHRYISAQGINFIKQCEGFRSKTYLCQGNFLTIGYGHKITKCETFSEINERIAEDLLIKDLYHAERAVLRYINVPLENFQFDALVSFTFNLGAASLQRSTLRQKVNYNQHIEAANEFLRWIYAGGKIIRGLINRRLKESQIYIGIS